MAALNLDLAWLLAAAITDGSDERVWTGAEGEADGLDTAPWISARDRAFGPAEKLRLVKLLFVPDPTDRERMALGRCAGLRFHRGQTVAVFPYDGLPTQAPFRATPAEKKLNKRAWLQPFWNFSIEHRRPFVHAFSSPPELVVARNSVLSAVHVDTSTGKAHLFMVWSAQKSGGEWSQPGGHVVRFGRSRFFIQTLALARPTQPISVILRNLGWHVASTLALSGLGSLAGPVSLPCDVAAGSHRPRPHRDGMPGVGRRGPRFPF